MDHLEREVLGPGELGSMVDRIAARDLDPYTAANDLLSRAVHSADRQSRDLQSPNQLPDHPITRLSNR
jgi:hypothetical protein